MMKSNLRPGRAVGLLRLSSNRRTRTNIDIDDALLAEAGRRLDETSALAREDARVQRLLVRTRQDLNATKYIQGLLRDLDEED